MSAMSDSLNTVTAHVDRIEGRGGLTIVVRSWRPASAPKAIVAVIPGFNSHSGYYAWVAEQCVAHGLAVYAVDLRGRGESDGERFYVDSFDDYVDDVARMVNLARSREPGLKVFVLGHSAGGVVGCLYTLANQQDLAGFICESFAFQVPAPDFAIAALKGLSHLAPHAHVLKLKNDDFSRDQAAVQKMNADPLIAHETQPTKTIAELARADERLKKAFPEFSLPLLILHGTEDKATKPGGSQIFYDAAASPDKRLKYYEGAYHDPLNDLGREAVMDDILRWIDYRAR